MSQPAQWIRYQVGKNNYLDVYSIPNVLVSWMKQSNLLCTVCTRRAVGRRRAGAAAGGAISQPLTLTAVGALIAAMCLIWWVVAVLRNFEYADVEGNLEEKEQ